MHLRSGKALKVMARPTNSSAFASSQSSHSPSQADSTHASAPIVGASVSTAIGTTMAMSDLTEMGIRAPTTVSTTAVAVTHKKIGNFVPPFTAGVHVSTGIPISPHPQVRARLDDRFKSKKNLSREQPYVMPTSMMTSLHNNAKKKKKKFA